VKIDSLSGAQVKSLCGNLSVAVYGDGMDIRRRQFSDSIFAFFQFEGISTSP
jgi:hypothetical protein